MPILPAPAFAGFIGTNEFIGQRQRSAGKTSQLDTPQALVAQLPLSSSGRGKALHEPAALAIECWAATFSSFVLQIRMPDGSVRQLQRHRRRCIVLVVHHSTGAARVNVISGVKQTNKSSYFNPETTPFWNAAVFSPSRTSS